MSVSLRWIFFIAATLIIMGGVFAKQKTTLVHARPLIADNIITIQNIRKLSDIIFLPQIVLSEDRLPHFELQLSGRDMEKLNSALPRGDYTAIEAAQTAEPEEPPTSKPSSRMRRLAVKSAFWSSTLTYSSIKSLSRTAGKKSYPMPSTR